MVKIRLRRVGAKKQPSYRVVVADSRAPRDGRFIETIGHYDPRTDPPTVRIYEDRALYWLSQGAQPTEAVAAYFEKLGLAAKLAAVRDGAEIEAVAAPRPAPQEAVRAAGRRRPKAAPAEPEPAAEAAGAGEAAVETAAVGEEAAEAADEAQAQAAATVEAVTEAVPAEKVGAEATEPAEVAALEPETRARATGAALPALDDLGLSARVAKALEEAGVDSAQALAKLLAAGEDKLIELPGIGAKAVDEIRAKLAEHGLDTES